MKIKAMVEVVMVVDVDGELEEPENLMILDYENPDPSDVLQAEVIEVLETEENIL